MCTLLIFYLQRFQISKVHYFINKNSANVMKVMISGPPTPIFIWFLWNQMGVLMVVLWKSHRALIRLTGVARVVCIVA